MRCIILVMAALLAMAAPFSAAAPALASPLPSEDEVGLNEAELAERVRRGRLSQDEIIQMGEDLPYFTRLKLYFYAQELEPYFEGVEERIRDLARSDPGDTRALDAAREALAQAMATARTRLMAAGRDEPEKDWRRGLLGLIWLDQDWRRRVREQGKTEITNPYPLVPLMDCLDARLRGIETGGVEQCPHRAPAREEQAPVEKSSE